MDYKENYIYVIAKVNYDGYGCSYNGEIIRAFRNYNDAVAYCNYNGISLGGGWPTVCIDKIKLY